MQINIFQIMLLSIMGILAFNLEVYGSENSRADTLWQAYIARFFQADGRILDSGIDPETTSSEAQIYTLFMSLVANDKTKFDTLLSWIEVHLAKGNIKQNLPGWNWGKRKDGEWTLLDKNSASDADLWLAYTLFQAGTLWNEPLYTDLGKAVLVQVKQTEITNLKGFGIMLIPGPNGFIIQDTVRVNPSYLPLQLIRYFQTVDPAGPWLELSENTIKMFRTFPRNISPDWSVYNTNTGWIYTETEWPYGSYDAIRTYLWAGMLHPADPVKPELLNILNGMLNVLKVTQTPPHKINIVNGELETGAPPGFSAAMLPFLQSQNEKDLVKRQFKTIERHLKNDLIGENPRYYDQILTLFGLSWYENRFNFNIDGSLQVRWHK